MYSFDSGFDTVITYIEWVEDGDTQYRENANKTFEKFSYYNKLFDSFHDYENINNIKQLMIMLALRLYRLTKKLLICY